jgi:hypothetical protein
VSLLQNGTTYDFRLRATNASGDSPASNVVTARPMPPAPQPPGGLTARAGNGVVTLRWGTVEGSRYGSSLAFTGTDGPDMCANWVVRATTRWMDANDCWAEAQMWSSVVNGC